MTSVPAYRSRVGRRLDRLLVASVDCRSVQSLGGDGSDLSKYVLTSYWHEFRPDIKHQMAKRRRAFQRP